jgi:hypothetical protein
MPLMPEQAGFTSTAPVWRMILTPWRETSNPKYQRIDVANLAVKEGKSTSGGRLK